MNVIPEEYIEILEREVRGRASQTDRERLEGFLENHPEMNAEVEETARMLRMLNSVPQQSPPPSLRDTVMRSIRSERPVQHTASIFSKVSEWILSHTNGKANTMKLIPSTPQQWVLAISGIVIVAAGIGYLSTVYPPPRQGETQGTMGGAEKAAKYQSDQMSEKDVVISRTEVQEMLQNDMIQKVIKDPAFQKAYVDTMFQNGIGSNEMKVVMGNENFQKAMANPLFVKGIVANQSKLFEQIQLVLAGSNSAKLLPYMNNENFKAALQSPLFVKAVTSNPVKAVFGNPQFLAAAQVASVRQAVAYGVIGLYMSNPQLKAAFGNAVTAQSKAAVQAQQ